MSLTVDKFSLLASLPPLRQKSDSSVVSVTGGFAETFDKALGSTDSPVSTATHKAKELAQTLSMQMLQSSLNLSGDYSTANSLSPGPPQLSSLLDAYRRTSRAAGREQTVQSPSTSPLSQLQESTDTASVELPANTRNGASWLDPIITKASRKYGVDAGLIKAVIKAESDFNPEAVSHAGARGLMQLMPATARSLGVVDSFDPEQNVMGGTRFLKDMLQRYNGNVDSALAAYNWGPGNVDKRPENLPRETREYLTRVKQLYASYNV